MTMPYDILVYAVGAETRAFAIPDVKEVRTASPRFVVLWKLSLLIVTTHFLACGHSSICALPEAEKLRDRVRDCIESAAFPDGSEEEVDRLMHTIGAGGGPTGVEFSGEMHDFIEDD